MPQDPSKPVILLAFANEQGRPGQYLRDLPDEVRRLQATLEQAEGLCQVVLRPNATLEDILGVFLNPGYRDRIAIFHYGGHANSYQLLLEGAKRQTLPADAAGLADFLGQQRGLQLVFLNGCSTQAQVARLQQAGVPVVIATARAIKDDVATDFAGLFYQSLAAKASLQRAYLEAESALKSHHGSGSPRGLYWAEAEAADAWPWALYEREAGAAGWQLLDFAPLSPDSQAGLAAARQRLAEMPTGAIPGIVTLPPGSRMPFARNPNFVGREAELKALARSLKGGETAAIGQVAAATGLGGIGKSQLAVEFVHRYGQYFAGGVFWLNFADPALVKTEIADCGRPGYLNLSPDFSNLDLDDQLALVLSAWQSPIPRLLIFDNCEDEALLRDYRPPTGGSRVLLTSRRATWSPALGVQPLPLDVLDPTESLALLHRYLPDSESSPTHPSSFILHPSSFRRSP